MPQRHLHLSTIWPVRMMLQTWVRSRRQSKGSFYLIHQPAKLGYKQELRRNFTMIEVFGIAFSIMGLLPSIASTLAYSIPAGPVGMVWVRERSHDFEGQRLTCNRAGFWHRDSFSSSVWPW